MSKNVLKVLAIVLCIAGCGGTLKETVAPSGGVLWITTSSSDWGKQSCSVPLCRLFPSAGRTEI